jgi:AAA+ ATPase superfamily predicted ATPase
MTNGNRERELLKEFLNFCVRLTKETHLSHVVMLTSNTVFVERIYNDAKMKKTSLFYKVAHLSKEKVEEWLKLEGFNEKDAEIIWDYLGGCIADILRVFSIRKNGKKELKGYLEEQKWLAYTEIDEYLAEFGEKETEFLLKVAEEIVEKGYFSISGLKIDRRKLLQKWAEREILFYDPLELKVTGNSRIYEKGLELLLERHKT